ncbi:MAG: anti-sigma regulatory factor [Gemmatimonadales bacterium]
MADPAQWTIAADLDVVRARQGVRELAASAGFSAGDQTVIAAAISEIARNILMYARTGTISARLERNGDREGIVMVAEDHGPGIADIRRASQDGVSTSGGLGLGLPGARRLMDDFEIASEYGRGTTITMKKWKRVHAG